MKLLIAGGRDFMNYYWVERVINLLLDEHPIDMILCGACPTGADQCAVHYCELNNFPLETYPADWKTHGRAAGPIRNRQMAKIADVAAIWWDKQSRGTANMIKTIRAEKIRDLHIFYYGAGIDEPQPNSLY